MVSEALSRARPGYRLELLEGKHVPVPGVGAPHALDRGPCGGLSEQRGGGALLPQGLLNTCVCHFNPLLLGVACYVNPLYFGVTK